MNSVSQARDMKPVMLTFLRFLFIMIYNNI
jgi:hypothetical protein